MEVRIPYEFEAQRERLLQLFDPDVAELDNRAVAEKTDVSGLSREAGVVSPIHCSQLDSLADVLIQNHDTIEFDGYPPAPGCDLLGIPIPDRAQKSRFGRNDTVKGPVILVRLQILVLVR